MVFDMEEDREILIILGRPFLATRGALIDMQHGEMTLRVNDVKVKFTIYHDKKISNITSTIIRSMLSIVWWMHIEIRR